MTTTQPMSYQGEVEPILRSARWPFIVSAVLSGLCVVATLGVFASSDYREFLILVVFTCTATYVLTIAAASIASMRMSHLIDLSPNARVFMLAMDAIAGLGLMTICACMWMWVWAVRTEAGDPTEKLMGGIGVGFLLMGLTTFRHQMLYTSLGRAFRREGFTTTGVWLAILGWTKAVYEFLWLAVCIALPLIGLSMNQGQHFEEGAIFLLFGALFGLFGFALVWVLMIVMHSVAASRRKSLGHVRGAFEVLPVQKM
jgi:hypothetical protein